MLALKPKPDELPWHQQFSPNDPFDCDAAEVGMWVDMQAGSALLKTPVQDNRSGFVYLLDRTNTKLLAANRYVKGNWADKIDSAAGRPVESAVMERVRTGADEAITPSVLGGKNWQPMSCNPSTGLA